MKLYQSASDRPHHETMLTHFGTLSAAAIRIESKFSSVRHRLYDGQEGFTLYDASYKQVGSESIDATLDAFAAFATTQKLSMYDVAVNKPMQLNDLWDDDPIASGGIGILISEFLTDRQISQLKRIFAPFEGVMGILEIQSRIDHATLKKAKKYCEQNPFAKRQITMRKRRSLAKGEPWDIVSLFESFWVHRTMEFRQWAINAGYDGFIYENFTEGQGEQSVVCLHDKQATLIQSVTFDSDSYLSRVRPIFKAFLQRNLTPDSNLRRNKDGQICDLLWAGMAPESFWR
ncbi:MAG TPA: hypothetical protein VLE50_00075 [Cellvibrio sp.]|jgi:hypothetical protein|nr:hypothetical protein [Cellvibrio sp.]